MEKKLFSAFRIWLIVALVIVAGGMVLFGVLGFNGTTENANGYEVVVSVDQNENGSGEVVKKSAEDYFNSVAFGNKYQKQVADDGAQYIYKFTNKVEIDKDALKTAIQNALDNDSNTKNAGLIADVVLSETEVYNPVIAGYVAIALGIATVLIFVYLLIAEGLKSSFAVISSAVISIIITLSLIGLTRLPLTDITTIALFGAYIIGAVLSAVMVNRFKVLTKSADTEKADAFEIAGKGVCASKTRYLLTLILSVVFSLLFIVFNNKYALFFGIEFALTSIVSVITSYIWTPYVWAKLKGAKKA